MKQIIAYSFAFIVLVVSACSATRKSAGDSAHNSRNSLDWQGLYAATLPCADCEGIETMLWLHKDNTYRMEQVYKGKSSKPVTTSGKFSWSSDGSTITLGDKDGRIFKLGENKLVQVYSDGKEVGEASAFQYTLQKDNSRLGGRTWKLEQLNGKPVAGRNAAGEPHIIFSPASGRVNGSTGCNNFFGNYKVAATTGGLSLGQVGSTKRACPGMETEAAFLGALQQTTGYKVAADTLVLLGARSVQLARFHAAKQVNK